MRTTSGVILAAILLTAVALAENTIAPWTPFQVVHAILAIAIPLRLGTYRFGSLRAFPWWGWPLALAAGLALQAATAVFLGEGVTRVLGALGVPEERTFDAFHWFPAALGRVFDAGAARWGTDPATFAKFYVGFVVLWAGLGEELFYRGYVHGTLSRKHGFALAATVSAALFGARHAAQLSLAGPPFPWPAALEWVALSFLLGLLFSWLYEKTGSLVLPVALHYCFNLVPTLQLFAG